MAKRAVTDDDGILLSAITTTSRREWHAEGFSHAIKNNVKIDFKRTNINVLHSRKGLPTVGPQILTKRWKIGLESARHTVEATTQLLIQTTLHLTLSHRFRTNDQQLQYHRLAHEMYTDTLFANTTSWFRKNKCAQIFCTRFGWTCVYPMHSKANAHEGLSLMFQRDGVPPLIIMDGSKEQTMGEFKKKARAAGCRIKLTEPYSPWQNAAESAVRQTKHGAGRKMAVSQCL
jgi:hypothetical protein